MYNNPRFKETDAVAILSFMKAYPFVTLLGVDKNGRIEATQVPVLVEEIGEKILITGHIVRKSSHQLALAENPEALVLFTGPHAYISGSWYITNPQQVSTWNYVSLQARGTLRWTSDEEMITQLQKMSLHFENGNALSSTVYDNLSPDYLNGLIKAIVGFEILVTEIDHVIKMSQNRDEQSYDSIVKELKLQTGDSLHIAEIMESRKSNIFPA